MLTFKLIEVINGFYNYEIYPEGKVENKGVIIFNPETKEIMKKIEPNSPFDCISHFTQGLVDENGELKKSGMVAWY